MIPVIAAAVGLAVMIACGVALWDQARCHHDETCPHAPLTDESYADALAVNCPVCDDRLPEAACTCLGQCGRRQCDPGATAAIASLYPREDVEFLADISGHLEEYL